MELNKIFITDLCEPLIFDKSSQFRGKKNNLLNKMMLEQLNIYTDDKDKELKSKTLYCLQKQNMINSNRGYVFF